MSMMVVWSSCKRITEPEGPLGQSLIIQIFSLFLKLSLAAWKQEKKKKKRNGEHFLETEGSQRCGILG